MGVRISINNSCFDCVAILVILWTHYFFRNTLFKSYYCNRGPKKATRHLRVRLCLIYISSNLRYIFIYRYIILFMEQNSLGLSILYQILIGYFLPNMEMAICFDWNLTKQQLHGQSFCLMSRFLEVKWGPIGIKGFKSIYLVWHWCTCKVPLVNHKIYLFNKWRNIIEFIILVIDIDLFWFRLCRCILEFD